MKAVEYGALFAHKVKRHFALRDIAGIADVRARQPAEFERLRDLIRQSGTDDLAYFGNGYTHEGGLLLQQNPDEFAALTLLLKAHAPLENYLEIGSASGGACLFLYRELGFERAWSLDDRQHPRAAAQPEHFAQIPNLRQFVGDSHSQAAHDFMREHVRDLDVAFIDGDHSAEGVQQDIDLVLPYCRKGALVILHDTVTPICPGVEQAWLRAVRAKRLKPLAEFVGAERPFGIAVGSVL